MFKSPLFGVQPLRPRRTNQSGRARDAVQGMQAQSSRRNNPGGKAKPSLVCLCILQRCSREGSCNSRLNPLEMIFKSQAAWSPRPGRCSNTVVCLEKQILHQQVGRRRRRGWITHSALLFAVSCPSSMDVETPSSRNGLARATHDTLLLDFFCPSR